MMNNQFFAQVGLTIAAIIVLVHGLVTASISSLNCAFILFTASVVVFGFPNSGEP